MIWLTEHWLLVLVWASIVTCNAYIIGSAVYALALANEARKEDAQRQRLEALINLSSAQRSKLPPALGARPPRPRKNTVRASGLASERKAVS